MLVKTLEEGEDFCRWAAEKTGLPIRLPLGVELGIACGKIHYKEPEQDVTNPHLAAQPAATQEPGCPPSPGSRTLPSCRITYRGRLLCNRPHRPYSICFMNSQWNA